MKTEQIEIELNIEIQRQAIEDYAALSREARENMEFHKELDEYLASVPEPTEAELAAHQDKMILLESIHKEIELENKPEAQPGDDWEHDSKLDFKYLEPYGMGTI